MAACMPSTFRCSHVAHMTMVAVFRGSQAQGEHGFTVHRAAHYIITSIRVQCHLANLMNESINLCASTARASAASAFASAAANILSASAARASAALARAWACASATLTAVLARVGASTT